MVPGRRYFFAGSPASLVAATSCLLAVGCGSAGGRPQDAAVGSGGAIGERDDSGGDGVGGGGTGDGHGGSGAGGSLIGGTGGATGVGGAGGAPPTLFPAPAISYATGSPGAYSIAAGDLDGDGNADLAVANFGATDGQSAATRGAMSVLFGDGSGGFRSPVVYQAGIGTHGVTIGDLNGDGRPDIVVANNGTSAVTGAYVVDGSVSVFLNVTASGAFAPAIDYAAGLRPESVAIGDLDEDGHADLLVANNGSNDVSLLRGSGDGTFAAAVAYPAGPAPKTVVMGDLDGDGHLDLVVTDNGDSNVSVLFGRDDGSLAAAVAYPLGGTNLHSATLGDLNGDGHPDLATCSINGSAGAGLVNVLLNDGHGAFGRATAYAAGPSTFYGDLGDLDGDGRLDLATVNEGDNTVSVFLNLGSGVLGAPLTLPVGVGPSAVEVTDLDRDGRPDVVTVNQGDGTVSVLLNRRP